MSGCVPVPQSFHPLLCPSLVCLWQVQPAAKILLLTGRLLAHHRCCKNQTLSDRLTCPEFQSRRQMKSVSSLKLNYYNNGNGN